MTSCGVGRYVRGMKPKVRLICGLLALALAVAGAAPAAMGLGAGKHDKKFTVEVLF